MRTVISISDEDEFRRDARLTLHISFDITGAPQLTHGDTFVLSLLGESVRLHRKHWTAPENICTLMCFGRRELLTKLSGMGVAVPKSDGEAFTLSPQVWK